MYQLGAHDFDMDYVQRPGFCESPKRFARDIAS
jgi:hypothetical protein